MPTDYVDLYLQAILKCWDLQETMEQLKGTTVYRHDIKKNAGHLAKSIERLLDKDLNAVWGIDDNVLFHQLDYYHDLIKHIASLKTDDNGVIATIIDMYKQNPEKVLKALEITIIDA